MKNSYQKHEMDGGGSSETTANFYENLRNSGKFLQEISETMENFYTKLPKLWKISTRNMKWREEVPPKLQQISTRSLRNYRKYLPETLNGGRRLLRNVGKFLTLK